MTYLECQTCDGSGTVVVDGTPTNCPECGGWGHVDDGEAVDD